MREELGVGLAFLCAAPAGLRRRGLDNRETLNHSCDECEAEKYEELGCSLLGPGVG